MSTMSKLHNRIKKKLHEKKGASLSEVLVTVLIMSIAMAAITVGITAAVRVYHQVRTKAEAQVLMSTTIAALSQDLQSATEAPNGELGSFYSAYRGSYISFVNGTDKDRGIWIRLSSEENAGDFAVVPNPDGKKLYTKITGLTFHPDDEITNDHQASFGYFTCTITVYTTDPVVKKGGSDTVETQEVSVRSMLPVKVSPDR